MAIGDDALAAGMDLVSGAEQANTLDTEDNKTRDYIVSFFNQAKAYVDAAVGAISLSWASITGKPSSFPPSAHSHDRVQSGGNWFGWRGGSTWGTGDNLSVGSDLGVDGTIYGNDERLAGHLYVPASSAAASGYTIAYINTDGRLSRGASSERYKKFISEIDPESLGDLWPDLQRFQMRTGDGSWKYGYIAERLGESENLRPFVVYNSEGQPDSIDFIALLMVQNAQLNKRLKALEEGS